MFQKSLGFHESEDTSISLLLILPCQAKQGDLIECTFQGFYPSSSNLAAIGQSAVARIDANQHRAEKRTLLRINTDAYNRIRNLLKLARLLAFNWLGLAPRRRDLRPQFHWSARPSTSPCLRIACFVFSRQASSRHVQKLVSKGQDSVFHQPVCLVQLTGPSLFIVAAVSDDNRAIAEASTYTWDDKRPSNQSFTPTPPPCRAARMAPATPPQHRWICNRPAKETSRHCCLRELQTPKGQMQRGTTRVQFVHRQFAGLYLSY
jgi:hypothetical protein